jgi:hypothetical protein
MLNPPPDPDASLEAEQRADDDGMPEHPLKATDPVSWADDLAEREKIHAAGYPIHPVARAWADLTHTASRLVDRLTPARPVMTTSTVLGIGAGLAIYMLLLRNGRQRYR